MDKPAPRQKDNLVQALHLLSASSGRNFSNSLFSRIFTEGGTGLWLVKFEGFFAAAAIRHWDFSKTTQAFFRRRLSILL